MRLEQLQYFVEVAKTNSIRLASENLFVSQPAISTAITKLEHELGIILFIRSRNGIFLTDIGKQILPEVTATFEHINRIKDIAHTKKYDTYKTISGSFSLRITPAVSLSIFSSLLEHLRFIFPNVSVYCYDAGPEEIRKSFTSDQFDLNIFSIIVNTHEDTPSFSFQEEHADLVLQQLYVCRLFCTASKHSPLAKKSHISLDELSQYPLGCLNYLAEKENYLQRLFNKKNTKLNISFTTTNPAHLIKQIESGACYGISDSLVERSYNVAFIPLSDPIKLQMWASYYATNENLPIITETIQFIKNYMPKN